MSAAVLPAVGEVLVLDVGAVAHGGHCVARYEGVVVFVRHTMPGERVRAQVTSTERRFVRADAIEVLEPAAGRVVPRCPHAGPGLCGGCDWQHVDLALQREWKAAVVAEQLGYLAGLRGGVADVVVEPVPGDDQGYGWRTRQRFGIDEDGRAGLHRHHSDVLVPLDVCPITAPGVPLGDVLDNRWPGVDGVTTVGTSTGERVLLPDPVPRPMPAVGDDVTVPGVRGARRRIRETAAGRTWQVEVDGFWQVHPGAADTLVAAVRDAAQVRPGDRVLDLYAGVGLFAGALAGSAGDSGRVDAVEADQGAVTAARRNLHDLPTVQLHAATVARWLRGPEARRCDVVVLDPPRTGAGERVLSSLLALAPRRIVYVACDPAALARDVGWLARNGWDLLALRAFDMFPQTHHIECVATLTPR